LRDDSEDCHYEFIRAIQTLTFPDDHDEDKSDYGAFIQI